LGVGTTAAAKAAPDGYTLMVGLTGNMSVNPSLFANLSYDPLADFTPLAMLDLNAGSCCCADGLRGPMTSAVVEFSARQLGREKPTSRAALKRCSGAKSKISYVLNCSIGDTAENGGYVIAAAPRPVFRTSALLGTPFSPTAQPDSRQSFPCCRSHRALCSPQAAPAHVHCQG
jgi:hypothetical protein